MFVAFNLVQRLNNLKGFLLDLVSRTGWKVWPFSKPHLTLNTLTTFLAPAGTLILGANWNLLGPKNVLLASEKLKCSKIEQIFMLLQDRMKRQKGTSGLVPAIK